DNNIAKLSKADAKFFLVNISPSQKEIAFLKEQYGEDGTKEQLRAFAGRVMDAYAQNFKREGINSHEDLVWFGKLENYRYYSYNDQEVKQGLKKRGDRKDGEQMHIQVVVSRKDITNKIKLSPQNASRGRNEEHSKKMGQFDRVAFKQSGESLFDSLFEFDRQLRDMLAYANAQKNGSLEERVQMETAVQNEHGQSAVDQVQEQFTESISINISDDIDDEAIHGRNRRRSKQARTNSR
ncbi:MAG: molybdopterin-guanine dinucleotide biosynthesis protein MobB, partial [Chitinophagaceae bacterium]